MHEKIVFFDIDGTLVDDDKNIPVSAKQAIDELKRNDVYVAIATGRAPFMFEHIRQELEIESYVSFNGQYVVLDRKSTRLNSSHVAISYAVFCLKQKNHDVL